ncbi:unnamed protein product [Lepeophtheirus salmonis]|uniref:(salmon louse) hypothetical protein n=1 Tax=Lepeophtheirus salmonis TaxID=72036 RepID=A0A7R8GYM8_LEPSM|nr:unnamed protein product [Lepeophtheirus salmonis]CAF2749510.1 unnamed protein product [Lepeophtheirus salmonis]
MTPKKGDAALAAALQDTLGPGFKLDSRDMDDIFKDMIDEGDSKDENPADDHLKQESECSISKYSLETSECTTIPSNICSQSLPNQKPIQVNNHQIVHQQTGLNVIAQRQPPSIGQQHPQTYATTEPTNRTTTKSSASAVDDVATKTVFPSDSQSSWGNSNPSVMNPSQSAQMPVRNYTISTAAPLHLGYSSTHRAEIPPPQSTQKAQLMKWESDEPLGDQATIAMILYANKNHPNLKVEYPQWSDLLQILRDLFSFQKHLRLLLTKICIGKKYNNKDNKMDHQKVEDQQRLQVNGNHGPDIIGDSSLVPTSTPISQSVTVSAKVHFSNSSTSQESNNVTSTKSSNFAILLQREKSPATGVTTSRVWVPEPGLPPSSNHSNIQFRQPLPPRPGMRVITPHHFYPNVQQIEQRTRMVASQQPMQHMNTSQSPMQSLKQVGNNPEFLNQQQKLILQTHQPLQKPTANNSPVGQSSPLLAQQLAGTPPSSAPPLPSPTGLSSVAPAPKTTSSSDSCDSVKIKKSDDPNKIEPLDRIDQEELGDFGVGEDDLLGMEDEESKEAAAIASASSPPEADPPSSTEVNLNSLSSQSKKPHSEPPPYRGPPPPYPGKLAASTAPKQSSLHFALADQFVILIPKQCLHVFLCHTLTILKELFWYRNSHFLLEDLLEQEKREQLQQQPQKSESGLPFSSGEMNQGNNIPRMLSPSQPQKTPTTTANDETPADT